MVPVGSLYVVTLYATSVRMPNYDKLTIHLAVSQGFICELEHSLESVRGEVFSVNTKFVDCCE